MKILITKRNLHKKEKELLVQELYNFPHIGLLNESGWKMFDNIYVATKNSNFIGICAVVYLNSWIKIGPLVILSNHQNKGYGKELFNFVVNNNTNKNLYLGSSNPIVDSFAKASGFTTANSYFKLPIVIKLYIFSYLLKRLNPNYLLDAFKKLSLKKHRYNYYLKSANKRI